MYVCIGLPDAKVYGHYNTFIQNVQVSALSIVELLLFLLNIIPL